MIPDLNTAVLYSVKIFAIIAALLYVAFSLIVVKQVTTMTKNVVDKFNSILVIFSIVHLIFSLFIVFLTLTIL